MLRARNGTETITGDRNVAGAIISFKKKQLSTKKNPKITKRMLKEGHHNLIGKVVLLFYDFCT
jgi:hypothetical protein